ncbi:hypothetical protein HYQ46_000217 [Verticillium longisporum]|nr:hypothetical protein HYQ46_000217 [Verticillium longisporum]
MTGGPRHRCRGPSLQGRPAALRSVGGLLPRRRRSARGRVGGASSGLADSRVKRILVGCVGLRAGRATKASLGPARPPRKGPGPPS